MDEYITEIKEISAKKVLIYINDAPSFALYKNEPEKLGIRTGEVLTQEKKAELFGDILYKRALNRALGLIKTRDHSTFEIRDKLMHDHYPEEICSDVIKEITEQGFLDDRRFARTYISFYSSVKSQPFLKMNLLKKGIDKEIIDEELENFKDENPDTEKEMIEKLLSSKYGEGVSAGSFEDEGEKYRFKSKVLAFLMRKGISYEKAAEGIKNYFDI